MRFAATGRHDARLQGPGKIQSRVRYWVQVVSDDREIAGILQELVAAVEENGGYFHPDLGVHCRDGHLSLHAPGVAEDEYLIKIPHRCLVPVDEFGWGLDGDRIVINSVAASATELQKKMAGFMIAIYNRAGKMKNFNKICLFDRVGKYRELIELVFSARNLEVYKSAIVNHSGAAGQRVQSFLHTRCYGLKESEDSTEVKKVMMPVIDFMNHHCWGAIFEPATLAGSGAGGERFFAEKCSKPVAGSDESFAYYGGIYDSFDMFLIYQYIDNHVYIVRSVPLRIDLGEIGAIRIDAALTRPVHKNLPSWLADLEFYLPQYGYDKKCREVSLGYVFIPGATAPYALRRVIVQAIKVLHNSLTDEQLNRYVLVAEERIIKSNIDYYARLEEHLAGIAPPLEDEEFIQLLKDLAGHQVEKIKNYPFYRQATGAGMQ